MDLLIVCHALACSGNGVRTCDSTGSWGTPVACVDQTCNAGVCTGVCAVGQAKCAGNAVSTCDASGSWNDGVLCADQTCVGGACTGVCAPGQKKCTGSTPQTCSAVGTWQNQATCTQPAPDCQAGTCTCLETLCGGTTCTLLNTPTNCTACGDKCNLTNATAASCTGTTCSYVCNGGSSDCNKTTPPDLDGCECTTPGCCGTACQTTHADGVGQSFYDCSPLSTYSAASAMEACTAYAPTQGGTAANCSDGWTCGALPGATFVCYGDASGMTCLTFCWDYVGSTKGWVAGCASCNAKAGSWN